MFYEANMEINDYRTFIILRKNEIYCSYDCICSAISPVTIPLSFVNVISTDTV